VSIRVTVVQMGAVGAKEENLAKARALLDSLARLQPGPDFVCLPEMFSYLPDPADDFEAIDRVAEEINGPTAQMLSEHARRLKCHLIGGSFIEKRAGRHLNTSLLFGPEGDLLAQYSKTHLFDAPDFKESDFVAPGDHITVVQTDHCQIGMIVCYDIRFPELLRTLTLKGAELIFCPAAFPVAGASPGYDHWQILTRAAALQNMVYLVAVNQLGIKSPLTFFGRSVVVDPWGIEIAVAPNQEGFFSAELDLHYLREMRRQRSPLDHRRPDLYDL